MAVEDTPDTTITEDDVQEARLTILRLHTHLAELKKAIENMQSTCEVINTTVEEATAPVSSTD